jgi:hypothetical protein
MSTARTKSRPASRVATAVAVSGVNTWIVPTVLGAVAVVAAGATSLEVVPAPLGLAVTILAILALIAERALATSLGTTTPGSAVAIAIGVVWIAVCYVPFHALLFPGQPLHEPITLHAEDATLPVNIATSGHRLLDLMLEAQLPPNPAGGTAIPVQYVLTFEDGAAARQVLTGRFDESLRTQRLGRRGTATVLQTHHAERRLLQNAAGADVTVTAVSLEPAAGSSVTITAYAHPLPSTPILVVLFLLILAAVVAVDTRILPASDGTFTLATPGVLGAALTLWTSNTVHPTVSSLIGSIIFGGPLGLALGALLWALARRTLVDDPG